jgi:hypothetical protein
MWYVLRWACYCFVYIRFQWALGLGYWRLGGNVWNLTCVITTALQAQAGKSCWDFLSLRVSCTWASFEIKPLTRPWPPLIRHPFPFEVSSNDDGHRSDPGPFMTNVPFSLLRDVVHESAYTAIPTETIGPWWWRLSTVLTSSAMLTFGFASIQIEIPRLIYWHDWGWHSLKLAASYLCNGQARGPAMLNDLKGGLWTFTGFMMFSTAIANIPSHNQPRVVKPLWSQSFTSK